VPSASGIAFANDRIGYAFLTSYDGGSETWVTQDGARSWRRVEGRATDALAIAGKWAYRVTFRGGGCPGPCDLRIERAATGSTAWRTVDVPPYSGDGAGIAASGRAVLVTLPGNPAGGEPSAQTAYLMSDDTGRTWRMHDDPCGGKGHHEWDTSTVAVHRATIAALCTKRFMRGSATVISSDFGSSWTPRRATPIRWGGALGLPESSRLIGAAAVGSGGGAAFVVDVSGNGGATWARAVTAPSFASDANQAVSTVIDCAGGGCAVLVDPHQLFVTEDGGRSWAGSRLPG
jgi:hypothetical protein